MLKRFVKRAAPRALWMCAVAGVASGCVGQRVSQLETELQTVKDDLVELRRSQAAQRVQFDEFRNRIIVLQDKLESARLAATRVVAKPQLPELPQVVIRPEQRATRHIVIGPDNVPHVTGPPLSRPRPAGPPEGVAKAPTSGMNTTPEDMAAGVYREAKALLDGGHLRRARLAFEAFLKRYGGHPLADNAMYWIGETWYAKAMWVKAARAFYDVIRRFPKGNKVPAAMLKTALCYRRLGETKDANAVFDELIRLYPKSSEADLARRKR